MGDVEKKKRRKRKRRRKKKKRWRKMMEEIEAFPVQPGVGNSE